MTKIIVAKQIQNKTGDLLVYPLSNLDVKVKRGGRRSDLASLDADCSGAISRIIKQREFKPKGGASLSIDLAQKGLPGRVVLLGWDKTSESRYHEVEQYRKLGSLIFANAQRIKAAQVTLLASQIDLSKEENLSALLEGFELSSYRFTRYKSSKDKRHVIKTLSIVCHDKVSRDGLLRGEVLAKATSLARDLINTPPIDCTPAFLVKHARDVARSGKLRCQVWDRKALNRMGAGGLIGVSMGSAEGSYLVKLTYRPKKRTKRVVSLVGKGITFDSGGLSIKTGDGMMTMKCDMSGAAAVIAAMSAIAQLKPDCEVRGYIPTCENMIGPSALRPGDVIRMLNKKTVEVLNTDAEGRLILADALSMAAKDGCDEVIDIATLTGACVTALGSDYAGLLSNNRKMAKGILAAGDISGELFWELPLVKEYAAQMKSPVADLKNIGSRSKGGGTIIGALFLQEFVADTAWAHLDIAGPAFVDGAKDYITAGGVGFGVRTLVRYLFD